LDVNDNAPEFHGRPYSFTVAETTRLGTTVFSNITITDKDGGLNADIMLSCAADKDDEDVCSTFGVAAEKVNVSYILFCYKCLLCTYFKESLHKGLLK
jgi:hypothetical protein